MTTVYATDSARQNSMLNRLARSMSNALHEETLTYTVEVAAIQVKQHFEVRGLYRRTYRSLVVGRRP